MDLVVIEIRRHRRVTVGILLIQRREGETDCEWPMISQFHCDAVRYNLLQSFTPLLDREPQVVAGQPPFFGALVLNTVLINPGGQEPPPEETGVKLLAAGRVLLVEG